MFKATPPLSPNLQAPGKGLPKLELFFARILVAFKLRKISPQENLKTFLAQKEEILSLVKGITPELGSKQVLIKRLPGLEDSSRFWSIYMTIEHLRIVNRSIIDVTRSLLQGIKPEFVINTAAVKPEQGIDASVVASFESICDEFQNSFPASTKLKTSVTLAHPWFGELNAEQWHFFAGFHMSLHKKQILKILEQL